MKRHSFNQLVYAQGNPCITISMNTPGHQSYNPQLQTELERLVDQAKFLLLEKYAEKKASLHNILERLSLIPYQVSFDDHLESLNIFLSEDAKEILFSMWPVAHNRVQVAEKFDIRPLVNIFNNTEEYHILLLSHKKVKLFYAINNKIIKEINNRDFPVTENLRFLEPHFKSADAEEEESLLHFFSEIDKKLIKLYNATGLRYVIISSDDNYERFSETALFSSIYAAHVPISNDLTRRTMAAESWNAIQLLQKEQRRRDVNLIKQLVSKGKAITDPNYILKVSREGKGDVLIVNEDASLPEKQEDLICEAVWNVINKHGNVVLVSGDEVDFDNNIALKLKY